MRFSAMLHSDTYVVIACAQGRPTKFEKRGSERGGRRKDIRAFNPHRMVAWYCSLCDGVGRFINGDTNVM